FAVEERAGERLLVPVEIDDGDFRAGVAERHAAVKRQRRFADAAFFICENNNMPVRSRTRKNILHDDLRMYSMGENVSPFGWYRTIFESVWISFRHCTGPPMSAESTRFPQ